MGERVLVGLWRCSRQVLLGTLSSSLFSATSFGGLRRASEADAAVPAEAALAASFLALL